MLMLMIMMMTGRFERAMCVFGTMRRKKCPSCNARAKKGDIRPIWAPKLVATDTSARDEALAKCQAEQNKRIKVHSCTTTFCTDRRRTHHILLVVFVRRWRPKTLV